MVALLPKINMEARARRTSGRLALTKMEDGDRFHDTDLRKIQLVRNADPHLAPQISLKLADPQAQGPVSPIAIARLFAESPIPAARSLPAGLVPLKAAPLRFVLHNVMQFARPLPGDMPD